MLRIGHKGADALVQGNTLESFAAAVEAGVDAIEFDVLRPRGDFDQASDWRRAPAGPGRASGPLLVAHDWGDASRRRPLTLRGRARRAGRAAVRAAALRSRPEGRRTRGRGGGGARRARPDVERAMVSTMELESVVYLRDAAPELDRGWTLPKVSRDWSRSPWLRPVFLAGSASLRTRLPAPRPPPRPRARGLGGVDLPPADHQAPASTAPTPSDVAVIAWTVDDADADRAPRRRSASTGSAPTTRVCSRAATSSAPLSSESACGEPRGHLARRREAIERDAEDAAHRLDDQHRDDQQQDADERDRRARGQRRRSPSSDAHR